MTKALINKVRSIFRRMGFIALAPASHRSESEGAFSYYGDRLLTGYTLMFPLPTPAPEAVRVRALRRLLRQELRRQHELEEDLIRFRAPSECGTLVFDRYFKKLVKRFNVALEQLQLTGEIVHVHMILAARKESSASRDGSSSAQDELEFISDAMDEAYFRNVRGL